MATPHPIDIACQRFGRLTILRNIPRPAYHADRSSWWQARCDCGKIVEISRSSLMNGTRSCGCLRREASRSRMLQFNHERKEQHAE